MELIRVLPPEVVAKALEAWRWVGLDDLEPWFVTAFGDVFFLADDGVYWLDVTTGELARPFADGEEAQRVLSTDEGMDEYLLAALAFAADEAGMVADGQRVLAFKDPPVLGGEYEVANLAPEDVIAVLSAAGRLHHRIKDLPDGAEITPAD